MKNLPDRAAAALYHLILRFFPDTGSRNRVSLELLHSGGDAGALQESFYVKKLKTSLLVLAVGLAFSSLMHFQTLQKRLVRQDDLVREEFDGEDRELDLVADTGSERSEISLILRTRTLSEEEEQKYYERFARDLPKLILGENPDANHVTKDLNLREEYEGYPYEVEWRSSQPDRIRSFGGKVTEVSEETKVRLTAKITYRDVSRSLEIPVLLIPGESSEADAFGRDLREELERREEEGREEGEYVLPERLGEKEIRWTREASDHSGTVWRGSSLTALVVYFLSDRDLEQELEKRRERMRRRYPDVVWMLTLYMGAGLGAREAFRRIYEEYEGRRKRGDPEDPIYEEIGRTCRELHMGRSEGDCYDTLGRRTGSQEYIRLCALLTQNLSKGDSRLLIRLREETETASRAGVQNCRRAAEEAGTKVLVPMVLLLLVVMVMIMTPAFGAQGV